MLNVTVLSTQISYKYHIYAKCRLLDRPINLIVYLKCYHVKYTNFSSISYLDTFSSWCSLMSCFAQNCKVNDIFVHFQDICSNNHHIYAQCRL